MDLFGDLVMAELRCLLCDLCRLHSIPGHCVGDELSTSLYSMVSTEQALLGEGWEWDARLEGISCLGLE